VAAGRGALLEVVKHNKWRRKEEQEEEEEVYLYRGGLHICVGIRVRHV